MASPARPPWAPSLPQIRVFRQPQISYSRLPDRATWICCGGDMRQPQGMNYVAARYDEEGARLWIYLQTLLLAGRVFSWSAWMTFAEYTRLELADAAWMEPMDNLWVSRASNRAYGENGRLNKQKIVELWEDLYGRRQYGVPQVSHAREMW